jgi:monoamine oxidase
VQAGVRRRRRRTPKNAKKTPTFGRSANETFVTRWQEDPFSYGSYSYLLVGAKPNTRKLVAAKVKNLLYFAGEHTSKNFPATVQGALLSGEAAADAASKVWA